MGKLLSFITGVGMVCVFSIFAQPDPDATAVLDDFEDTWGDKPNQTNMGAVKGYLEYGETLVHKGGGWWYSFFDEEGSVVMNGAQDDTVGSTNADVMVEEETRNSFIHVWLRTDESLLDYPFAGIGCLLSGTADGNIHDLSSLTAIKLKVKGDGFVALRVETQDVSTVYDWGFYQTNIDLTSDWVEVTIPVSELVPPAYSEPAEQDWTWDHGKAQATKLSIQVKDGDYAEFYVDDITLEGMKYADFVPIIVTDYNPYLSTKNLWVSGNTITYILQDPQQVLLGIYDLKGKLVNELVNKKEVAGTHAVRWNGERTSGANIANGTYIVRLNAGLQSGNTPLTIVK